MTTGFSYSLPVDDLDHALVHTEGLWQEVHGKRLFISGGSGFVGTWLVETLIWAKEKRMLETEIVVLTRDPDTLASRRPYLLKQSALSFCKGNITDFSFPPGSFAYVIHAASRSYKPPPGSDPVALFQEDVDGTRRMLDFAVQASAKAFLFTSSGAAYGSQPPDVARLGEDLALAPETADADSGYGQAKRVSEWLCSAYAKQHGLDTRIARLFTFIGPHLPLDSHFPAGNFIRDALRGGPIRIASDGTACRSYLYAADLAVWLWTILIRGKAARVYNVGSSESMTIAGLAKLVAEAVGGDIPMEVGQKPDPGKPVSRYVPEIERARLELGLETWIDVRDAICRTVSWHKSQG